MEPAWRSDFGYTSPNPAVYPWMWLWDSCFHSVIWATLGDRRAVHELESLFELQEPDGFMPHLGYQADPGAAAALWGRQGTSTITQPPMYGHAIRMAAEQGFEIPEAVLERAVAGLRHLVESRSTSRGLLAIVHPWESGCDDSARWGSWMPDPFSKPEWDATKRHLIPVDGRHAVALDEHPFVVESAMFNALFAFNVAELDSVIGSSGLGDVADRIARRLAERWSDTEHTWTDGDHSSADAPTLEALLPLLVVSDDEAIDEAWSVVFDPEWFGAPLGPRQTAPHQSGFDPDAYWRGPTWPQLNYLLWIAARRSGRHDVASTLAEMTVAGAVTSGHAEYWNADTGEGHGARPQSWSCLAWVMQEGDR